MRITDRRRLWALALGVVAFCGGLWVAHSWYSAQTPAQPAFMLPPLELRAPTPDFSLTDGNGHVQTLSNFRGRVVVMFFGFTRCPDVCPTELFKLSQVMQSLGEDAEHVQVLFITLDPERDTPELLSNYTAAFNPSFLGLTGTRQQIDALAKDYFVVHARVPVGDSYVIDHSTFTYILDRQGRLRLLARMDTPGPTLVHDLRLLVHDATRDSNS
ncbi:SCO family protein [Peristeroidobacter soli]|jgi:protein SCO1/2|uniref:SCO family protein n=1 Tax=Peristeroidobacter soli TaxID=2497877 RepID=UPI00101C6E74|nr:SCO family protein [Peristeroidobacter soli]